MSEMKHWKEIANGNWQHPTDSNGKLDRETISCATLTGIYIELKKLNTLLSCHNCVDIPNILRRISRNTAKPKKRKTKR